MTSGRKGRMEGREGSPGPPPLTPHCLVPTPGAPDVRTFPLLSARHPATCSGSVGRYLQLACVPDVLVETPLHFSGVFGSCSAVGAFPPRGSSDSDSSGRQPSHRHLHLPHLISAWSRTFQPPPHAGPHTLPSVCYRQDNTFRKGPD